MATWTKISVDDVAAVIADAVRPLLARIADLEAKAATTRSSAPGVKWAGVFREGNIYEAGQLVTHAGSLWLTRRQTDGKPGASPDDFVLVCKRGDFGR
jgi:hypothetical protein